MATLFSTAIVAFCTATSTAQYNSACTSAIDAGSRQSGLHQNVDLVEYRVISYVNYEALSLTSKPVQDIFGISLFFYQTARDRRLQVKLPTLGIFESIASTLSPNSYFLSIGWKLR